MILTMKASVAAAVIVGTIAATAGITYAVFQSSMATTVNCPVPMAAAQARLPDGSASADSGQQLLMCRLRIYAGVAAAGATLFESAPAYAQSSDVLDQIVSQFQSQSGAWENGLRSLALETFGLLAIIELAAAAIRLAFRGADFSEWLAELVNQILYLGFFLALLQNSVTWGTAIVNSFRHAGKSAAGGGMTPSAVFAAGVDMAQAVTGHMSWYSPASSMALLIAGLVVLVCFALICAWMMVALVESYVVIAASVILMAFGGSRWTKDIAIAAIRYTLSVGAKLMMMQLLVSLGTNMITGWANTFTGQNSSQVYILIGASIVLLAVTKIFLTTCNELWAARAFRVAPASWVLRRQLGEPRLPLLQASQAVGRWLATHFGSLLHSLIKRMTKALHHSHALGELPH